MKLFYRLGYCLIPCILWIGCQNKENPQWSEQLLVKDSSALYLHPHRLIIDSIFAKQKDQLDSLWKTDAYAHDSLAHRYFRLSYITNQLNKGNLTPAEAFLETYPEELFTSLGEFAVKYTLIKARLWGEQRKLPEADSLFERTLVMANQYVEGGHSLALQIINARIIMWRYIANDANKTLQILSKMDSMLLQRHDFSRYHRDYYYTLATTYRIVGKLDEALSSALILREQLIRESNIDSVYLVALSKVIGNIYTDIGDPVQAGQYFREQIDYNLSHHKLKAHDLLNFAIQLALYDNLAIAKDYIHKSESLLITSEDTFHYQRVSAFYFMKNEEHALARISLDKAISYLTKHPDQHLYPTLLTWLGEWYDLNHFPDSAIHIYSQAISYRCKDKKLLQIGVEDLRDQDDIELIFSLLVRAFNNLYELTNDKKLLDLANSYTVLIERYFETIALNYEGINRLINFQYFHETFGYGAHANFIKYKLTSDSAHLVKCLQLLEKCKSFEWDIYNSLLEIDLSEGEKNMVNQFRTFRQKIVELEFQAETHRTAHHVKDLQLLLYKRDRWIQELKDSFPRLHRLFESPNKTIDFNRLVNLTDSTTLIYFHWNRLRTYYYTFTLDSVKLAYYENSKGINDTISSYLDLLRNKGKPKYNVDTERYYSHTLWTKWRQNIDTSQKKIVVIPDGPVHNLAFSALYSDPIQNQMVGDSYQVTYSFNLKSALKPKPIPHYNSILAMAYGKADEKEIYASLPGTILEVEQMLKKWKGKKVYYFKNEETTKENFIKYAPLVDVIYLATHAETDPYNRFRNRLVFHGPTGQNEFLHLSDLFNIKLRTKLVILSACNSSQSRYYRGNVLTLLSLLYFRGNSIIAYTIPINDSYIGKINNYCNKFL